MVSKDNASLFWKSSSSSPRHSPSTCSKTGRRSKRYLIGVQAVKPLLCLCPSSRVLALEVCLREGTKAARDLILLFGSDFKTHTLSRRNSYFCGLSVQSRQGVGRKEGRERERRRGDELFEAERVVKLRLVQTKTGETRQLWKSGQGQPQVSLPLTSF